MRAMAVILVLSVLSGVTSGGAVHTVDEPPPFKSRFTAKLQKVFEAVMACRSDYVYQDQAYQCGDYMVQGVRWQALDLDLVKTDKVTKRVVPHTVNLGMLVDEWSQSRDRRYMRRLRKLLVWDFAARVDGAEGAEARHDAVSDACRAADPELSELPERYKCKLLRQVDWWLHDSFDSHGLVGEEERLVAMYIGYRQTLQAMDGVYPGLIAPVKGSALGDSFTKSLLGSKGQLHVYDISDYDSDSGTMPVPRAAQRGAWADLQSFMSAACCRVPWAGLYIADPPAPKVSERPSDLERAVALRANLAVVPAEGPAHDYGVRRAMCIAAGVSSRSIEEAELQSKRESVGVMALWLSRVCPFQPGKELVQTLFGEAGTGTQMIVMNALSGAGEEERLWSEALTTQTVVSRRLHIVRSRLIHDKKLLHAIMFAISISQLVGGASAAAVTPESKDAATGVALRGSGDVQRASAPRGVAAASMALARSGPVDTNTDAGLGDAIHQSHSTAQYGEYLMQPEASLISQEYDSILEGMNIVNEEAIMKDIEDSAQRAGVAAADLTALVKAASSMGNVQGIPRLLKELQDQNLCVWQGSQDQGSISSVLSYSARKVTGYARGGDKNLFLHRRYDWRENRLEAFKRSGSDETPVLLVDHVLIDQVASNPRLAAEVRNAVKSGYVTVASIKGMDDLTMFNQQRHSEVIGQLADRLKATEGSSAGTFGLGLFGSTSKSLEERIDDVLKSPVQEWANEFFDEDQDVLMINVPGSPADTDAEVIAANLSPKVPSLHELTDAIDSVATGNTALAETIVKTLKTNGRFYSMSNLGDLSRSLYNTMEEDWGAPDLYLVPDADKSYGLIARVFMEANKGHVNVDQFVDFPQLEEKTKGLSQKLGRKVRVAILDDIGGTGKSLQEYADECVGKKARAELRHRNLDVRVAPLLESDKATEHFRQYGIRSFTADTVASSQGNLQPWMGGTGYLGGSYFISFPIMSPDNNNNFFATKLAPLFTLDQAGVKDATGGVAPMPTAADRLKGFLQYQRVMHEGGYKKVTVPEERVEKQMSVVEAYPEIAPECFSFVYQYYCRAKAIPQEQRMSSPKIPVEGMLEALRRGRWANEYVGRGPGSEFYSGSNKPTASCVESAVRAMGEAGILLMENAGKLFAVPDAPGLCPNLGYNGWGNNKLTDFFVKGARDAGLMGFVDKSVRKEDESTFWWTDEKIRRHEWEMEMYD